MSRHQDQTANHIIESWVYPNAAARTGATGFVTADIGRIAYQSDTGGYWRLASTAPTWASLGDPISAIITEISVTGATTLTLGRYHVCSGTTADYTVTLPPASGNAGAMIGIRMSNSLTKFVTVDGNSTELIDGKQTRVMWAGESAVLLCDGTGWNKISGKTIPMVCRMRRTAAFSTLATGVSTTVPLDTTRYDNTGRMADPTTNFRVNIVRDGNYMVAGFLQIIGFNASNIQVNLATNGTTGTIAFANVGNTTSTYITHALAGVMYSAVVGDFVSIQVYQDSGGNQSINQPNNALTVVEVPSW